MYPKFHILFGLIFSAVVLLIFPQIHISGFMIIWASSVLIDVDHYLFYVWRKKDISLKNAHRWYIKYDKKFNSLTKEQKSKCAVGIYFLHGIEAIALLLILFLIFNNIIFIYIIIGFVFHQILDLIDIYNKKIKYYKVISFFYSIYKNKGKKYLDISDE